MLCSLFVLLRLLFFSWIVLITTGARKRRSHSNLFETVDAVEIKSSFYIYEWPQEIIDCWPFNYTHHRLAFEGKFRQNRGLGPLLHPEVGMYHTHQYSLFTSFYQRLLESKYRTRDPIAAKAFFIPYDIGMDSSSRQSDGALSQTNCPRLNRVMQLLSTSAYFQRNHGNDHFTLLSINQPMHYFLNLKCMEFYKFCYNCSKFSIDVYNGALYASLRDRPYMTHKWHSVPFPANL